MHRENGMNSVDEGRPFRSLRVIRPEPQNSRECSDSSHVVMDALYLVTSVVNASGEREKICFEAHLFVCRSGIPSNVDADRRIVRADSVTTFALSTAT